MRIGIKKWERTIIYFAYKSHSIQASISTLFILIFTLSIKRMLNFDFKFTKYILKDSIVQDYLSFLTEIHNNIINTKDENYQLKFSNIGIFLLVIHISNRLVDIVYHVTPGSKNILIKTNRNLKVILELKDSSTLVEIKCLENNKFAE